MLETSQGRSCPSTRGSCIRRSRPRVPSVTGRVDQATVLAEMPDCVLGLAHRLVKTREVEVAVGEVRVLFDGGVVGLDGGAGFPEVLKQHAVVEHEEGV